MKTNLTENNSVSTALLYAEHMLICQTAELALIAFLTICSYSTGTVYLSLTIFSTMYLIPCMNLAQKLHRKSSFAYLLGRARR